MLFCGAYKLLSVSLFLFRNFVVKPVIIQSNSERCNYRIPGHIGLGLGLVLGFGSELMLGF